MMIMVAVFEADVDKLIAATGTNTSRGQTILAELIEIFDMYSMQELKEKYLATAESLKNLLMKDF